MCQQSGLCPSAGANTFVNKRRWVGNGSCSERGPAWAACGVYGAAWECVNTARDLESCTSSHTRCVCFRNTDSIFVACSPVLQKRWVAALFRSLPALVTARTVLPFLASQTLHRLPLSPRVPARAHDGRSCVRKYSHFDDGEDLPASVYELEHLPLGRH